MIQDAKITVAVSQISQRAERQDELKKLVETYVDIGILPQLKNSNHQIFYGRRGTGKTHVLKVLESSLNESAQNTVLYVDCRTLGSSSQFANTNLGIEQRCLALFRDIVIEVQRALHTRVVEHAPTASDQALVSLDELLTLVTQAFEVVKRRHKEQSDTETRSKTKELGGSGGSSALGLFAKLEGKLRGSSSSRISLKEKYDVDVVEKIVFPELSRCLRDVLKHASTSLYILIDEWSSLPMDIQPYLAEFLKRSFVPLGGVTLKIAALEHRCKFRVSHSGNAVGLEIGADIATTQDLDDYYVFDRNPAHATGVFGDIPSCGK